MGYIVLPAQLRAINRLTEGANIESIELLWLPGVIQLTIWTDGIADLLRIDEDGNTYGT
jgi:hypothetical protein